MGIEIERKFLVKETTWQLIKSTTTPIDIQQGYLSLEAERTVRVRIKKQQGILTIKGKSRGISRVEYEYPIPLADAQDLLKLCIGAIIKKKRYLIREGTLTWEVDEFSGANQGLIIAEIELEQENQSIVLPPWIDREVSNDTRYYNSNLVSHPFENWTD